ncbi:hypothetical protein KEM55_006242 [Ascosphaera atra]|nr:hypothetical protein KEM55_006242 [Ascosphaera atra]
MPTDRRFTNKNTSQGASATATASTTNTYRQNEPTIFSQPANTGTGREKMTQVIFAIEHLKAKGTAMTFADIASYLSLAQQGYDEAHMNSIEGVLQRNDKVEYNPDDANGQGTYRFKPKHNIRNAEQLLQALQSRPTGQGMSVVELREGWPNIVPTINQLEKEGKLLVTRNKKEDYPKMVWTNDPTLITTFDPEFKQIWERIKIPDPDTVIEELEKAGITPTNKNKVVKAKPKMEKKRTKKTRRSGKTTNTHMAGILRDYSHLKP